MIKKYKYLIVVLLLVVSLFSVVGINGSSATTNTFAVNRKSQFVITQTAYLPDQTHLDFSIPDYETYGLSNDYLGLNEPQDMFIDENDLIYIADTGNKRIVVFDPVANEIVKIITNDNFSSPKGIYISNEGLLYVADSSAGGIVDGVRDNKNGSVFVLDLDGNEIDRIYRPTSASFGEDKVFAPKKIAVDGLGSMYIVGEGLYDGILQLSSSGEFLGYFASNDVTLTTRQRLENWLFSDEQLDTVVDRTPPGFSNIYVDERGIKYTTSHGEDLSNLQKHNTDGSSSIDTNWGWDMALVDVYTDNNGVIYAASDEGYIFVFTNDGGFIFGFGTQSQQDVVGFYEELASIAVDSKGTIWTLDQTNSFLQSYTPTEYTTRIYNALEYYRQGKYEEAVLEWEDVLKLNQMSVLAHREIGRNLVGLYRYEEAMEHFILSGNRGMYSEAYWQVRYVDMQEGLPGFLLLLISSIVLYQVIKRTNKRYSYLAKPKAFIRKIYEIQFINDFLYMFAFVKHPLDSFYYLKRKDRGSYKAATTIFTVFFIIYMISVTSKGFIYQTVEPADLDLGGIILGFFSIFVLFIVSNYLVTSINDGEGSIGEIFKGVTYSLMPLGISLLVTTWLSHYLTYDEVIFLDIISNVGLFWTGTLIFLAVQELHNYTIRETIKSFLLTGLFMLIVAVLFSFIQIMGDQLIQFIMMLIEEAIRNVFS